VHSTLARGRPDNPAGHWESPEIFALHDAFLEAIGSSWDDPRPIPPGAFDTAAAASCQVSIRRLLERDFAHTRLFVEKDPRLCRLAPLWRPLLDELGVRTFAVLPQRHPLEVARSLAQRDGIAQHQALANWLIDTLTAERHTRGLPRVFVRYEAFLERPTETAARLIDEFDCFDLERAEVGLRQVRLQWQSALRHHVAPAEPMPTWVQETYAWVIAAAAGEEPPGDILDAVFDKLSAALEIYRPMVLSSETRSAARRRRMGRRLD
jgi:hypothetical protein